MIQKLLLNSLVVALTFTAITASGSDKLAGGVKAGSTSISLPVELRKSADSTELTGIVYTGVTGSYWRQGGTRTSITTATLSGPSAAYSSGGFVEVDATNMPGVYRFDVPDAAFATGADWVVVSLKVSTAFQQTFMFALESSGAAEVMTRIGSAGAGLTALGDTRIANLDATISSRLADSSKPTNFSSLSITGGGAVTAGTVGDKTGYSLSQAFPANFSALAITGGGAVTAGDTSGTTTLLGRLTSTRASLLDNLDAAISTRSTYAGGDSSGVTTLLTRLPSALTLTGGKVDINDKTGFSLIQSFPVHFSNLSITSDGAVRSR